jgi:uncharacterized protein
LKVVILQSIQTYPVFYEAVEHYQAALAGDPVLARMFRQCYPGSLETTTERLEDGTTFVFTGDIPAMWLRDSAAQVRPYVPLAKHDPELQAMLRGLIRRQAHYIQLDPYANAFNREPNGAGHYSDQTEQPEMSAWVWERKYELDSLCYPIQLCQDYLNATGDSSIFDDHLHTTFALIVDVIAREQHHDQASRYRFVRTDCPPGDTIPFGSGTRTNFTGMSWSGFRPSDDACRFGYLIPSNMFAVVVLGYMAQFLHKYYDDAKLATRAETLCSEIDFGIQNYGIVDHPKYGKIYAYETDGYGNYTLMDDANVPSLLSIPYLGYRPASDPIYRNTRAFVLSRDNPYYAEGKHARGVGSPHTPPGRVWPIGMIMQGLTSTDQAERRALLDMLKTTTAGTDYIHESLDPDDPAQFSREWFGWANSLFGEFVIDWIQSEGMQP